MSDILQTILNGVSKRLKDMGDGSYAEVVYNINGGGGGGGGVFGGDVNLNEVGGNAFATGQQAKAASLPVTLASDDAAVAGIGAVGDTAYAGSGSSSVVAALKGLYARLGSVVLAAGTALLGDVGLQLRAANGLSTSYTSCGNSNNVTMVKAGAGAIGHIRVFNNSANVAYLKLYNKATAPNPASDTVFDKILIPANSSGAGVVLDIAYGQKFSTGIAFAVVTGFADTDNTAIAAGACCVTILYQ